MPNAEVATSRRQAERGGASKSSRKSDARFEELCRDYRTISERIERLERSETDYVTVEIEVLKRRRSTLLKEILAIRPDGERASDPDHTATAA